MSKQKSNFKQTDIDAAAPVACVSVRGKNDAKNDTKHNVDV